MPEFTKIRNFYIRRRKGKIDLPVQRLKGSPFERVILPAAAYKMSLTTMAPSENILARTVVDLVKACQAKGMDRGLAMDYASRRTLLNRQLVGAILKRYENNLDAETQEENEGVTQAFYYLIYDLLAQRPFPELIPSEEFDEGRQMESVSPPAADLTGTGDAALRFQTAISEKRQSAWLLHTGEKALPAPVSPPVTRALERRYCQGKNSALEYLNILEPVGLICTCYVTEGDLSTIHVMNPLGDGTMNALYGRIQETLQKEPEGNEALAGRLKSLDAVRRAALEEAENYSSAHDAMKLELQIEFPGIAMYRDVQEHMTVLRTRCAVYKDALENGPDTGEADSAAKECLVAFHSAMEELLALSLNKNYPRNREQLLEEMLDNVSAGRNNADYYAGIAEKAGFQEADVERLRTFFKSQDGRMKMSVVKKIMNSARKGNQVQRSLPEIVMAHIFQAAAAEEHPFRRAAALYPELLPLVKETKEKRDVFKHGLDERPVEARDGIAVPSREEILKMKSLAEDMLDILLTPRASEAEQKRQAEAYSIRRAARIRAEEGLEEYPDLKALAETAALKAGFDFYYGDPEYMSDCTNLLDRLYDILFNEYSNQSQRQAAAEQFTGSREQDDAAMHALFQRYGCDYASEDRPNTANICQFSWNVVGLSVKCKLYLAAVLLDREDPELLRRLLEKAPRFPWLTDQACMERGHNGRTVFSNSPDGYAGYHRELMESCQGFCQVLRTGKIRC